MAHRQEGLIERAVELFFEVRQVDFGLAHPIKIVQFDFFRKVRGVDEAIGFSFVAEVMGGECRDDLLAESECACSITEGFIRKDPPLFRVERDGGIREMKSAITIYGITDTAGRVGLTVARIFFNNGPLREGGGL